LVDDVARPSSTPARTLHSQRMPIGKLPLYPSSIRHQGPVSPRGHGRASPAALRKCKKRNSGPCPLSL
jgi:hypothetical protein